MQKTDFRCPSGHCRAPRAIGWFFAAWLAAGFCFAADLGDAPGSAAEENAAAEEESELVSLILMLLGDADRQIRALALQQIRNEAPGAAATRRFAAELETLPPDGQIGLLSALADRGDAAARPAVVQLLSGSNGAEVQIAAARALGPLGDVSDVPRLTGLLGHDSPEMRSAARSSLVRLGGRDVPAAIVEQMAAADVPRCVTLFEVLVERRARDAMPLFLFAAICDDAVLRRAAMAALAELGGAEQIPGMVRGVLAAQPGSERDAAEKCVADVCARIEDAGKRAEPLLAVFHEATLADRAALFSTLGRVGGPETLKAVEAALADPATHAAAVRALCNWPTADVAPRLIELSQADPHPEHRTAALRALVRIAPLPDERPDDERLALLKKVMAMCTRDEERRLVLDRAKAIRTVESLRFVVEYLEQPKFAQQACLTIVELAHHRALRDAHQEEFHAALDRVLEISADAVVKERATRYKNNQTWVRPQ